MEKLVPFMLIPFFSLPPLFVVSHLLIALVLTILVFAYFLEWNVYCSRCLHCSYVIVLHILTRSIYG